MFLGTNGFNTPACFWHRVLLRIMPGRYRGMVALAKNESQKAGGICKAIVISPQVFWKK
jgi:hypothetical protein